MRKRERQTEKDRQTQTDTDRHRHRQRDKERLGFTFLCLICVYALQGNRQIGRGREREGSDSHMIPSTDCHNVYMFDSISLKSNCFV